MDQGLHTFCYRISPFESLAKAEKEGQITNCNFTAVIDTFHPGKLSETYSGIEISEENITVTALKKHEDSDGWILRCYETEDKDTKTRISLFGTTWEAKFSHSEVKTFLVNGNTVTETDFIEW